MGGLAALGCLIVALAFATYGGFVALERALGTVDAALIVAGVYCLVGVAIMVALSRRAPPPAPKARSLRLVLTALTEGYRTGRSLRR